MAAALRTDVATLIAIAEGLIEGHLFGADPDLYRLSGSGPFPEVAPDALLRRAAAFWIEDHGTNGYPHERDASYSTSENEFLWAAENAWFAEAAAAPPPGPQPDPGPPREGFHLYRLWGAENRLLYVGVSTRLRARLRAHRRKLGVLVERETWEEHPDAESMLAAERVAVAEEMPALNKVLIH